jgi:hypothetical protein
MDGLPEQWPAGKRSVNEAAVSSIISQCKSSYLAPFVVALVRSPIDQDGTVGLAK